MSSGGQGCPGPAEKGATPTFFERRTVPLWWWLVALALVLPTTEAVVLGPEMSHHPSALLTWASLAGATVLVAACLIALGRSNVTVDQLGISAGGAVLPAGDVGRARALDRAETHRLLGPGLRADAHLSLRPWIKTAVQVEVAVQVQTAERQANAQCPYWIVATRKPTELVAALDEIRPRSTGQDLSGDYSNTEQKASS